MNTVKGRKIKKKKTHKKHKAKRIKSSTAKYGKYGIIQRIDNYTKQDEFYAWLSEIKNVSRDAISKREEEDLRQEFIEDFNTATLPKKKYYNLNKWIAKQSKNKNKKEDIVDNTNVNDEENVRKQVLEKREEDRRLKEQFRLNALISEIKQAKTKGGQAFKAVLSRNKDKAPTTFEEIAQKRREEKREKESQTYDY